MKTFNKSAREAQDRALRLLRCGPRSLRPLPGPEEGWGVYPQGDRRRRPLMQISSTVVNALRREGALAPSLRADQEWVAVIEGQANSMKDTNVLPPVIPLRTQKKGGRTNGFAHLLLLSKGGEGPLDERCVLAAQTYCGLWEKAHLSERVTQVWNGIHVDGRGTNDNLGYLHAAKARQQLTALNKKLSEPDAIVLRESLIDQLSLAQLETRSAWPKGTAGSKLSQVLLRAADIFDTMGSLN